MFTHAKSAATVATFVLLALTCCFSIGVATAQSTLNLSLERTWGTAFGMYIQGTFTLRGSGPEAVTNLTVLFNDEQVHFVTGNTVVWTFNTDDYPTGSTNVTLIGRDAEGTEYAAARIYVFLGSSVGGLITIGVLALVAVAVLVKYGSRIAGATRDRP